MKTFKDLRLKINSTRNELYNSLHSGEVSAFELTVLIGKHLKKLDDLSHEIDVELQSSQTGGECYKKVFIRSKDDLPKVNGMYWTVNKDRKYIGDRSFDKNDKLCLDIWLNDIDWYLQLLSESLPESQSPSEDKIMSAEEIFKKHHPLIYGMGTGEFKNNFISAMKEYASQFSQSQRKVVTDEDEFENFLRSFNTKVVLLSETQIQIVTHGYKKWMHNKLSK